MKPESERERAIRLDRLAQENCAAGKHSMVEVRNGMVCRYCGVVGDASITDPAPQWDGL